MDFIQIEGIVVLSGLVIIAVLVARYSMNIIFSTMQYFLSRYQQRSTLK